MKKKAAGREAETYRHAPNVAWRRVEEEAVLLNVDTSAYYSLDPIAADIWERLGKGETVSRIVRRIAQEFETPEDRVAKDAEGLIQDLLKEELLTATPDD
ncbi:MAG: hypothetical protein A2X36_13075 [Elusimicrobia bacterium GWA2_69_24]|nr:MAG: hypothetical protein A2X36_13075 [Elusimicrobia bacterium GWA2_69_24]HBL15445.1 hypothetical protein [Elusimicrobiota bacterium]